MSKDHQKLFAEPSEEIDKLAKEIVDCGFNVHKKIGPGLLERYYRDALIIEMKKRGFKVEKEVPYPVYYDGILLDGHYVLDLVVENKIVVELKTVDQLSDLHRSQLRTYLKISGHRLGLLINFNCYYYGDGVRRVIN
jgi:GxxExxY protein